MNRVSTHNRLEPISICISRRILFDGVTAWHVCHFEERVAFATRNLALARRRFLASLEMTSWDNDILGLRLLYLIRNLFEHDTLAFQSRRTQTTAVRENKFRSIMLW